MDVHEINKKIFTELGREKQLIDYHDIIHKLLGVVIDFINAEGESLKLSKMRHFNPFCSMLRAQKSGFQACQDCDRRNANQASLKQCESIYKCYAGLSEIVVPLYNDSGTYIGSMTSGQFHMEGTPMESSATIKRLAQAHNLNAGELQKAYDETRTLTKLQVEGLVDFLKTIGKIIVETHTKLLFWETINLPDKISMIKQYVHNNYMEKLTIPGTAKKFFLSEGHLCHLFKKEVGVSFISYVNVYRVSKAEELLRETQRNISEITYLAGFGSISQFNRIFKKIKDESPKEYRSRTQAPAKRSLR